MDPFDAYNLNLKMVLTMQQMGKAEAAFESIRSAFGIESTGVHGYSTYEQNIYLTHIRLAERILQENLEQEIEATRLLDDYEGDNNGKCGPRMAIDTGWTQRASGRCYKSPTGQILGQELAARRFVGVQLYNKNYGKCKFGKFHDGLMCSENYDGSSKGMEATGAEKVVLYCFGDEKTGSYIKC
jgi:hypothetical protein